MDEKKNENILIIYSCLQEFSFLTQNISIIYNFAKKLQDKYNIFIISSTDTLKITLDDDVKIITDKITEKNIIETIKKNNITKIIPIDCGFKIIDEVQKNVKVENLFSSFFDEYKSVKYFEKLAKISGFLQKPRYKRNQNNKKNYKTLNFICIKDKFNNQIILDSFETYYLNEKKIFLNVLDINKDIKNSINQLVYNFGELLKITNYIYNIKVKVDNENNIYFDEINYGLNEETLFSIQNQQLDIVEIILKLYNKNIFHYNKNNHKIALSYDYKNSLNIHFCTSLEKKSLLHSNNDNDKSIFLKTNKLSNEMVFLKKDENLNIIKDNEINLLGEYILICLGDYGLENINIQIFFYRICTLLKKYTNKKILLLTKTISPLLYFFNQITVALCDNFTDKNINTLLKQKNIKNAYIVPSGSTFNLISKIAETKIKLYSQDIEEIELLCLNEDGLIDFCNNIDVLCQYIKMDKKEAIVNFYCITDNHKNVIFQQITSENYQGKVNTYCHLCPALFLDYSLQEKVIKTANSIIDNLKSYGMLNIVFLYKNGNLFVQNITINCSPMLLFISNANKNLLYKTLLDSMLKTSIKTYKTEYKEENDKKKKFYQKICFEKIDKQIIELDDITKERVVNKYIKKFL